MFSQFKNYATAMASNKTCSKVCSIAVVPACILSIGLLFLVGVQLMIIFLYQR